MEKDKIIEEKKLLELAMDLYFINGAKSTRDCSASAIKSVCDAYEVFFGENSSIGQTEQDMIRNTLGCYENIGQLISGEGCKDVSLDELIMNQKKLLIIVKELSFIAGTKKRGKNVIASEEFLRGQYEAIFGKDTSKGLSTNRLALNAITKIENENYSGIAFRE